MTGAPNCCHPPWADSEKAIIEQAWSVEEACENHNAFYMVMVIGEHRTRKAIECEWLRLHPKIPDTHTRMNRMIGEALDELEATV